MSSKTMQIFFTVGMISVTTMTETGFAQKKKRAPNPAFAKVVDDPALPRVLLIGDSISIGYTVDVRKLLEGKANVHRIPANGGPTTRGLQSIDAWLGDSKWDVIHFNWGLHDLKYISEKGGLVAPEKGKQQVSIADYEKNLTKLVERLEQTKAKLIWRNTTPVPEGAAGRVVGDSAKYNAVAAKIMQQHNIPTDDQFSFVKPQMKKLMRPANVHFTAEGSLALAKQAVATIEKALPKK